MRKVYLLIYNDSVGPRELVKLWADSSPLVKTWRYDLPHCFYLVSEASAEELSANLRATLGTGGRFLITEISENRQGWLPADTWYLLRNKTIKPKK
jgi:hypothetical protein